MHEEIELAPLEGDVVEPTPALPVPMEGADGDLARLHDVPVELTVEIGRTRMTIGETLNLGPGAIVSLNRLAGEPVDLLVNGTPIARGEVVVIDEDTPIARGEVVVIDEEFGLRITEVGAGMARLGTEEQAA